MLLMTLATSLETKHSDLKRLFILLFILLLFGLFQCKVRRKEEARRREEKSRRRTGTAYK